MVPSGNLNPPVVLSTIPVAVTVPVLPTENLEAPLICKSANLEPAALAVSVAFNLIPLKEMAALFQVSVRS
jgi:hypothetical protein